MHPSAKAVAAGDIGAMVGGPAGEAGSSSSVGESGQGAIGNLRSVGAMPCHAVLGARE